MAVLPPPAPDCASCAARDAVIAEQARLLEEQAAAIAELRADLAFLAEQVAELRRQLGRNSGNSSMAPSADDLPGRKAPEPEPERRGGGQALVAESPGPLGPGLVIGRAAAHPHGFLSGGEPLQLLSIQLPRPSEGTTTWDQPGETTDPIDCAVAGSCRRCPRCGGPSLNVRGRVLLCATSKP